MRFSLISALFLGLLTLTSASTIPSDISKSTHLDELDFTTSSWPKKPAFLSTEESNFAQLEAWLESLPLDATPKQLAQAFRQQALLCSTVHNSIPIAEIHEAANEMLKAYQPGFVCRQTFPANTCTVLWEWKSTRIISCGKHNTGVKCTTLGWAAKHIANMCQQNGRAEGYYKFYLAGVTAKVM